MGHKVDIALCSREETRSEIVEQCGQVLLSGSPKGSVRDWGNVFSDLVRHEVLPEPDQDLLIVMPLRGLVSASRTRLFLEHALQDRVTVSTRQTQVNKNPFWNYVIYPDFVEKNLIRDVNLTKLPRLGKNHFTEENLKLMPAVDKLNGSHDLPVVYDRYDSYAYIPASGIEGLVRGQEPEPVIVKVRKGDDRPHLLHMLPVLNFHADAELSF